MSRSTISTFKKVTWTKRPRWTARIKVNYKTIYIGIFDTEEQAAQAYNEAATRYFGDFARTNEVQKCLD